ncbi:hypothetical protein D3C86_2098810 [compost metagenome]
MPRSRAASHNAGGSAEPPMMSFQPDKSWPLACAACNSICSKVGTQCENVTRSVSRNCSSMSGA